MMRCYTIACRAQPSTALALFAFLLVFACGGVASTRLGRTLQQPRAAATTLLAHISIPSAIAVPSGNTLHLAFLAVGYQNYIFNGTAWVLQNANAKLYYSTTRNDHDVIIGRHFFLPHPDASGGQPSWETFHPFSLVTARSLQAVTVDQDSITWSLLQATSNSGSKEWLGDVTYVQRLKTRHGLPPSSTARAAEGDTYSSAYSAIYAYYVKS